MLLCFCYCFSHLICLHSVTWLLLISIFTLIFMYFLFLSDEKPLLKTLDYTVRIGSTSTFLYFDLLLIMHYYAFIMHLLCIYYAFIIVSYIYSVIYLFSVSVWRTANARNVRVYYPYWQFTNIFTFWFVSLLSLVLRAEKTAPKAANSASLKHTTLFFTNSTSWTKETKS